MLIASCTGKAVRITTRLAMLALFTAANVGVPGTAAHSAETNKPMDWYQINDKAGVMLSTTRDEKALVTSLKARTNQSLENDLLLLGILIRLGHFDDAASVIGKFSQTTPIVNASASANQRRLFSDACDYLIGKKAYAAAKIFIEKFPQASPGYAQLLTEQIDKTDGDSKADAWLEARAAACPDDFWLKQRLRWRAERHTASSLFDSLLLEVKKNPANFKTCQRYVQLATSVARDKPDLGVLSGILKPKMAYESFLLGLDLQMDCPTAAVAMYERSLNTTFTPQDKSALLDYVRSHWSMANSISTIDWEKYLRQSTKENLVQAYKNAHEIAKAQKLMNELANAEPSGLPGLSLSTLSGQIQAQTPTKPIENKIIGAEPENKNSSDYWLTRATYYFGRKDKAATVSAYEKALDLCPLATESDCYKRGTVLNNYGVSLRSFRATDAEVTALLTREYHLAAPGTHYMQCVLSEMLYIDDSRRGSGQAVAMLIRDDQKLWQHLRAEKSWSLDFGRVLRELESQVPQGDKSQFWKRVVELTVGADSSKAYWVGDSMKRSGRSDLAVKMFERAHEQATRNLAAAEKQGAAADLIKRSVDENMLTLAQSEMFQCFIDLNDWKVAEAILRAQAAKETADTKQSYLGQLALAAARAGNKGRSLAFWKERALLDRNELGWLADLARAGMKSDLTEFYIKMRHDDPHSNTPAAALAILENVH